jgi:hypothetical protein
MYFLTRAGDLNPPGEREMYFLTRAGESFIIPSVPVQQA